MLTKTQARALRQLEQLLDPKNECFAGSPEVRAALEGPLKLYMETWVLPIIEMFDKPSIALEAVL